jgi:GR25 family glycosyltransferase involved in LPS biosynthesis
MTEIPIYCVTYQNPERREKMTRRFETVGLQFEFVESIAADDPNIRPSDDIMELTRQAKRWNPHAYSCIHGHFFAIERFLQTGKDICIVCEDDILLRRDFAEELPIVIANFKKLRLDILLLGYLDDHCKPAYVTYRRPLKAPAFSYHSYDHDWAQWGTQMYMIHRRHAEMLWNHYGPHTDFKIQSLIRHDIEYWYADCIITKMGNRALISPQLAVEEGTAGLAVQQPTHTNSYILNYDPEIHI